MSSRTCPDWPALLEVAPELHFKHYSVVEAQLPAEAVVNLADFPLEAIALCADLDHNVFNPAHTDPSVSAALGDSYWYDLSEWAARSPRA